MPAAVETLDDAIRRRRNECSDAAAQRFQRSIRPVLVAQAGQPVGFDGTCILLRVGGAKYVGTAAHVVDCLDSHQFYVTGAVGTQPVQMLGTVNMTAVPPDGRAADKIDVAFWRLTDAAADELGDVTFIDESEVYLNRAGLEHHQYLAMGYAVSKNKRSVENSHKALKPVLSKYTAELTDNSALCKKLRISGERHLFLKYQKVSESDKGERRNTFHPRGLSGGPLIHLGNFATMPRFEQTELPIGRLAGMIIEKHGDILVAVKIQVMIDAIRTSQAVFARKDA